MNDAAVDRQAPAEALRVEKAVYGGDGLARTGEGEIVLLPFVLPGELVLPAAGERRAAAILEASADRVEPRCVHFGACGGCQYQMAAYAAQLAMKAAILRETLERAGLEQLPEAQILGSPEEYGYRNRIRLRVRSGGPAGVHLGYSLRGTNDFLPVTMCPIAAPVLWATARALMSAATTSADAAEWMLSATEVELFCDAAEQQVQVHLLCAGTVPQRRGGLERFAEMLASAGRPVRSIVASQLHVASGRAGRLLAAWGPEGLVYRVGAQSFWLTRGNFFQVNRLLLPAMVQVVCAERAGTLAWDLFAGAGLFTRELRQRFERVVAVEANPEALAELQRGLRQGRDLAVQETTLAFLRKAVLQREWPELIVLDPPRAGAGEQACDLLLRLAPRELVYVSCDPATLARDLRVLQAGYDVERIHMLDLFPQTYHLETVMVLRRRGMQG